MVDSTAVNRWRWATSHGKQAAVISVDGGKTECAAVVPLTRPHLLATRPEKLITVKLRLTEVV